MSRGLGFGACQSDQGRVKAGGDSKTTNARRYLERPRSPAEVDEFLYKGTDEIGCDQRLTLNVKIECTPEGGFSPQNLEEVKSALRELGLDDRITTCGSPKSDFFARPATCANLRSAD